MKSYLNVPKKEALQIIQKHHILKPKVNLKQIIESDSELIILEKELPNHISGALRVEGKKGTILINRGHSPERKNFTLAHEYAHFVLHRENINTHVDENLFFRDDNVKNKREIEANQFAAEILMPTFMIINEIKKYQKNIQFNIDIFCINLAKKFNVSYQAMLIKLQEVGFIF